MRFAPQSLIAALLVFVALLPSPAGEPSGQNTEQKEPLPPDIIDVSLVGQSDTEATLEVSLKPSADGDVELVVPPGALPVNGSKARRPPPRVPRDGNRRSDRYRCLVDRTTPMSLSFRAVIRDETGKIVTQVTRVLKLNDDKKTPPDPQLERIPVVLTSPDGKQRVEYMTLSEAARRGLAPPLPAPSISTGPSTPPADR